jgi:hypothetical protein
MSFPVFHEPTSPKLGPSDLDLDLNPEHSLLGPDTNASEHAASEHATKTAPVFTEDVLRVLGPAVFPQRGFYGRVVGQHADGLPLKPARPGMYVNTNAPFSALVCGVQVSGLDLPRRGARLSVWNRGQARATRRLFSSRAA